MRDGGSEDSSALGILMIENGGLRGDTEIVKHRLSPFSPRDPTLMRL
jgi:hypothetical protein